MKSRLLPLALLSTLFIFQACDGPSNGKSGEETSARGVQQAQPAMSADGHNSMNALDWDGVYTGTVPCADCEGIKTMIQLNKDKTYVVKTKYLGESEEVYTSTGNFTWNEAGSKITLEAAGKDGRTQMYQVGENVLFHLDNDGNRITGDLASNYMLQKQQKGIEDRRWKLVELMGKKVAEMDPEPAKKAFLYLDSEDNSMSGSAGCNNLIGSYELQEGNRITFDSNMASTMMACLNPEMEEAFKEVLSKADNYSLNEDGAMLSLNKARMAPLARFEVDYME